MRIIDSDVTPEQITNTLADFDERINNIEVGAPRSKTLIATFTSSGAFNIASHGLNMGDKIDIYMTGGGGGGQGGAVSSNPTCGGGGGGAQCLFLKDFVLAAGSYNITVGIGGAGSAANTSGSEAAVASNGGNTIAFGQTANGGVGGGNSDGSSGGSGGGAAARVFAATTVNATNIQAQMGGIMGSHGGRPFSLRNQARGAGMSGGTRTDMVFINPYDYKIYGSGGGGGGGETTSVGGGNGGDFMVLPTPGNIGGNGGGGGNGGAEGQHTAVNAGASGGGGIVFIYAFVG